MKRGIWTKMDKSTEMDENGWKIIQVGCKREHSNSWSHTRCDNCVVKCMSMGNFIL